MKLDEAGQKARSSALRPPPFGMLMPLTVNNKPLNNRSLGDGSIALMFLEISNGFPKLLARSFTLPKTNIL